MGNVKPTECKSCGAKIVFIKTNTGKYIPVNSSTTANNKITAGDIYNSKKHTTHFATCPNASKHRILRVDSKNYG